LGTIFHRSVFYFKSEILDLYALVISNNFLIAVYYLKKQSKLLRNGLLFEFW